jgi:endo-1,3(4)-beta-glucanase
VNATGTQFNVTNTQGTTYIIYALTSITLKASKSGVIQANSTYNGIIRLVMLAQPTHQALLTQYAAVYPTSVSLDYVFSGSVGEINFKWNTVGDGRQLLMLTWPHHRLVMQKGTFPPISSLAYLTTKVSLSSA